MPIDKKYIDQIIKVSEKAALAASYLVGKKNKNAAELFFNINLLY